MKKILFVIAFLSLLQSKAQLYFPPTTGNTWDTMSPSRLGWCSARIDSLYNFLQSTNTDGFIVLKDGKIVLEKYFGTFTQDSLHFWASAGKSLTSMMIGIAQQKGLLNINDSVSKYLGVGWSSEPAAKEKLITVRNLLTMTSGMDDDPSFPCTNEDSATACLQYKADAGTRWAYHTGAYKKLEEIVSVVSGKTYNAATNEWIEANTGMSGLWFNAVYYSKARDMARYGLLALNKGVWASDTILCDTTYYRAMTNTSQNFNLSYGYLWWLNGKASAMVPGLQIVFPTKLIPDAPNDLFCALGKYDQKIYVVPSQQLVVIRTGESGFANQALSPYDTMIWNYINKLSTDCVTTSVIEKKSDVELRLYPNPANNFISFMGFGEEKDIHYSIANTSGVVVTEGETLSHSINVMDLSGGMYYLTIQSPNKQVTKQFLKN